MASEQTAKASDRSGGGEGGVKKGDDENPRKKVLPWARSRQLERDLEHVNREIYRRNLELAQTNKTLALLQAIDSLVLNADDALQPLATKLAYEVVKVGYPFVMILGYPSPFEEDLEAFGWAVADDVNKPSPLAIQKLRLRSDLGWLKSNETIKYVDLEAIGDEQIAAYCKCSAEQAAHARKLLNLKALSCVKLSARQQLVGVMIVGFAEHQQADLGEFERALFKRLSGAVGIAIDHKILFEENERVVGQLERSNRKLRMLDRTKDDFISMASHQLRTPLTSVKGYVSMVLEGDAGKLTPLQAKLLTQSFVSAQRMVYLISDLLNVSRLRTGKFIIEPVVCNLAEVIEEEIDQLTETAKSRNLDLSFHKPSHFPTYLLDETKLRQVIMNFVDNAVYYTPIGGHITVNLAETAKTIEFTVVDDGIGVPRPEQHHLFSKFYRAHNAKRARPDGTGLGLFMAKKVIIAQGGAVIFKSQEGKGSTFGFTFAKSKLELVPATAQLPKEITSKKHK